MNLAKQKIGFLGTGKMATALAEGFVAGPLDGSQIVGVDPVEAAQKSFEQAVSGAQTGADAALLKNCDVVFLAVKPQVLPSVLTTVQSHLAGGKLIVSIAAGVRMQKLQGWLPDDARLIRVMPNTPCLIGKGASGVSRSESATTKDEELVCELLQGVGIVERVSEPLLEALTGLSGSGPAYVFQIIEALSDGGVNVGLPRATATRLAAQTLLGAAELVLQTGEHPAALKDAVTSPGGTTIAGLQAMEQGGVRAALMNAVQRAVERGQQLG